MVAWLEVTDPSIAKLIHRQARPWAHETPLKMIGLDTVYMLMFWSLSSFFYVQGLSSVPLVEGNEAMMRAIITIAESQRYVALASWSAFAVSMVAISFCAQAFWRWRVSVPVHRGAVGVSQGGSETTRGFVKARKCLSRFSASASVVMLGSWRTWKRLA